MSESTVNLILWILPPVLGAVIGYVTNAVAIKMLFRPHREWRVLGIKVPLTPGIIPRQRYKLADNIGTMVSDELLTEDTLVTQLRSPKFQEGLETAVSKLTGDLLGTSILSIKEKSSANGALAGIAEDLIRGFLRSKGIKRIIYLVIHAGLHSLTGRTIGELFHDETRRERFIEWLYGLLRSPETGNKLAARAAEWLAEPKTQEATIGSYVPAEVKDWVVGIADVMYEPIFGFVLDWLESDGMQDQLKIRGRFLLRDILDKLSALQRFLVTAAQYDRTLDEKMPEIIKDVVVSMKETVYDEATKAKMLETIASSIEKIRSRTIGDTSDSYNIPEKVTRALDSIQSSIAKDPAGGSLKAAFRNILAQLEGRTVESFLERAFTVKDAAEYLTDMVAGGVQESADRISRAAADQLNDLASNAGDTPIGELLGFTPDATRRINKSLAGMAGRALETRVPGILRSLDLNGMVVAKINGLAVEDVEGLLLRVIHRHLKWINVFGAILGFLIGTIQILTRLF